MPDTRTKILLVNHEVEFGGAERSLIGLLATIDRTAFAPELVCSEDGPLSAAANGLDLPVHFVPMRFVGKARKAFGLLRAGRDIARLCEARGAHLLHANTLIAGYAASRAARLAKLPLIWHMRDTTYPRLGIRAARNADHIIANSRATAATLGPNAQVSVVYNGVEPAFFAARGDEARRALRAMLGVPDDTLVIGTVSRLDPQKGHDVLLAAAASMVTAPHFVIIGDVTFDSARREFGDLRAELVRQAKHLGLARRVHLLGHRDDVAELIAGCDVLAHPTLQHEAFGRSIAEAGAAGVPAVASDLGGIPEIIDHEVNGLLVPPGDRAALAAALDRICLDRSLRDRLGTAAQATARHCFTIPSHAAAIERVYREVLGVVGVGVG